SNAKTPTAASENMITAASRMRSAGSSSALRTPYSAHKSTAGVTNKNAVALLSVSLSNAVAGGKIGSKGKSDHADTGERSAKKQRGQEGGHNVAHDLAAVSQVKDRPRNAPKNLRCHSGENRVTSNLPQQTPDRHHWAQANCVSHCACEEHNPPAPPRGEHKRCE